MFFFFSLSLFVKPSPPISSSSTPTASHCHPSLPPSARFPSASHRRYRLLPPSSVAVSRFRTTFIPLRWSSRSWPVLSPITSSSVRLATFGRCWSFAAFCDRRRQPLTGFVDLGRFLVRTSFVAILPWLSTL